ncbi:helix-turn-helix transcriptional regulator [Staphylococcus hyicus]
MTNYHISFNALHPRTLYKNSGITFVFVLEGRLQCLFNNTNIDIESGKVLLLNHRDKLIINDLDGDFMQFNMNLQFIDHVIDGLPLFEPDPSDDSMKWIKNFLAKIGIMYLRKNKYFKLLIEQQMIELLLLMVKYIPQKDMEHGMATTEDMRLNRVCQYIEHHFNEEITLHDMAEYVNLSPAYLSKLFTKKLNMGFLQYLNKVRLDHVILDLIHTDKPMIEIALQNGFSNSALLSRTFKKQMNTTPTQYREVHQIHAQPKPHTSVSKKELILNLSR